MQAHADAHTGRKLANLRNELIGEVEDCANNLDMDYVCFNPSSA